MKRQMLSIAIATGLALTFASPASADVIATYTVRYNAPAIGQGDAGGICFLHDPTSPIPPQLHSCIDVYPPPEARYVDIFVVDNAGSPVYFSVQQDGNSGFAAGCGAVVGFPLSGGSPGGGPQGPIRVFPWFGPAVNPSFDPIGASPCVPGSLDLTGGTATFYFYD
jgi:hypothetical protein